MSAPNITSVPSNPILLGSSFTFSGTNFTGASSVQFGSLGCPPASFTVNDTGTEITIQVPTFPGTQQFPATMPISVIVPDQPLGNSVDVTIADPVNINTITLQNNSGLTSTDGNVWVAGFITQSLPNNRVLTLFLQSDGTFNAQTGLPQVAHFFNVDDMGAISVPNVSSTGNNRLLIAVTPAPPPSDGPTPHHNVPNPPTPVPTVPVPPASIVPGLGYTAYPFADAPGVCPPGPYDIFEFGPNAQYDLSAVDSFGLNLSFTVTGDPLTYGAQPTISRQNIAAAFTAFATADALGAPFKELLYSSPSEPNYPPLVKGQCSAIVSPKDWLAIYPASALAGYWKDTVNAFFLTGNKLNIDLNAANAGIYSGTSDGTQFILSGPNNMSITIPLSDFDGNKAFIQAVRAQNSDETLLEYQTFGQIEAAIFEAFSRGVALDGVVQSGNPITAGFSSDAWRTMANWFIVHENSFNVPTKYDVYARFFHYGTVQNAQNEPQHIFGTNANGTLGMAYGFSLDENPNVGPTWSTNDNVPAKTPYCVGINQDVTLTIGPWE